MSTQINKEDLLNFTHQLHNKLRGAKGIKLTGLPALNEIENILFFRFMEERTEIKDIPNEIKFTKICEKYATDEKLKEDLKIPILKDRNSYKLWSEFYDASDPDNVCILQQYFNNETIKKYIQSSVQKVSAFTESKRVAVAPTIQLLFNMVYNKFKNITFDSKFYDMFGTAHEEFKTNEHGNSGKHTGQHFTPMDIKKLVVDELDVKSKEIYYEPCAGTGGFIHTVDKYVREKEGVNASKKFKNNIYANECNPEMIKPLMINMLLHDIPVNNIHENDSLCNENVISMKEKADVIGTNYPFGMSNDINLSDYTDKTYWNCLVRGKNIIKNSTGQFILHIYNSLKQNGRTGFVSDRGILNNGDDKTWEGDVRKFMVENTNLYKIWFLPTGVFPYTSFSTCVIFFKKGEKTKEVKIYDGKFKDDKNKTGLYIEDKPIKIFTIDELKKNGYCFKLDDDKDEEVKDGWVKLGNICELYPTTKYCTSIGKENGKYRFYSSSQNDKLYIDTPEINKESIIIGNGGTANVHYDTNYTPSKHVTCCFINNDKYSTKYIYYFLRCNIKLLEDNFSGGGLKWLNREKIKKLQIPMLPLAQQEEIVSLLDTQFELYDINLLSKISNDISLFTFLLKKEYELFENALHLIYRKMELDALHKKMEKDKKAVFDIRVRTVKSEKVKLGDICEFKNGKCIKKDDLIHGKYPVIGGGQKPMGLHDKYNVNENTILCSSSGSYAGFISIYNTKVWASDCFSIIPKLNNINNFYLYLVLKNYQDKIYKYQIGNGQPHVYSKDLKNLIILVPSLEDQEKIIKDIEKIESEQSSYAEYAKLIQVQIDSLNQLVKNITENCNDGYSSICSNDDSCSSTNGSDAEEDNKHNIVSIKDIDYIEEDSNYYSIDTSGQKDCLCYTTDASGKIKKYKDILIKEPLVTMLSMSSGRNNKDILKKVPLETMLSMSSGRNNKNNM
jgi:type I restriction enzyme S subunit